MTRLIPRLETLAYARLGHKTSRAMGASCVRVSTGGALDLIGSTYINQESIFVE